jgi:hypothetical protein
MVIKLSASGVAGTYFAEDKCRFRSFTQNDLKAKNIRMSGLSLENGKPLERAGRKATGLNPGAIPGQGSRAAGRIQRAPAAASSSATHMIRRCRLARYRFQFTLRHFVPAGQTIRPVGPFQTAHHVDGHIAGSHFHASGYRICQ